MRTKLITLALAAMTLTGLNSYAGVEHMIPKPAQITVGAGSLNLPAGFAVGYPSDLSAEMATEIDNFLSALNHSTGLNATKASNGLITVAADATLPAEGYTLNVSSTGAEIKAATPAGLYYAFQTVKKLLPVNVAAGVQGSAGQTYALPEVNISDSPRFEYRGFMLDVSRHFFDVAQVKRMLDIMAVYKLNRFHWHLTDDQGWRLPMAKWPKLTVEGATNNDVLLTDFTAQTQVPSGAQYGPFSYTEEQIRDVVAYAAARHITVIPEVDMPGHMVAAIHAYPELSTDPEGKIYDHKMWNRGGVSQDVLDVSNPRVIEFAKDVIDVLVDLFPYEYIHVGGDECPTTAWEKSTSCVELKNSLNLSNFHGLQLNFVQQIAEYAKSKGRKIMSWNELVTNGSPDMNIIKEIDPAIFCWTGGEGICQNNGLKHIYTGFNGGYYINRAYAGYDKVGAVRDGSLATTLTVNPPLNSNCIGVQGTFWTEQVDRPTDLEYLALPRLLGIAEQGWAPVEKDYEEIMARLIADKELLDAAGYNYGAHQLVMPEYAKPDPDKWYTLASNCSDERSGNVFEVLAAGHAYIESKKGNGAQANRLWGCQLAAGNEYQQFRFVEDPANPGVYAIVCRALPDGSVSSTPTNTGLGGRWDYQASGLDYNFVFDKAYYKEMDGGAFRYAIRPKNLDGLYMNFSRNGQGQAINVYNNPNDGNGGQIIFNEVEETTPGPGPELGDMPKAGVYYRLHTRFSGDSGQARFGSVIELLRDDAGKGNNAQADRLWSNAPADKSAANFDYQYFRFDLDPNGSGYYAMVCKAKPEGSVNCTPTGANNANTARWDYDNTTKHYGFTLVKEHNGRSTQGTDNDGFYSAITSKDAASGWYMNTSAAGQGFSVHLWNDPLDQNAGLYTFEPLDTETSINNIHQTDNNGNVIYDLQGRRLSAPTRGINIINGHKVLVR